MNMVRGVIVVPAYNEAAGLPRFAGELASSLRPMLDGKLALTLFVVDDGSCDESPDVLQRLQRESSWPAGFEVRSLRLLRNFGHQGALLAGLIEASATADFVVTMDADGEHPAEVIPKLIGEWRAGSPIVHTIRRSSTRLSRFKRSTSAAYYWLLSRASGLEIQSGMADFKLWDGNLLRDVCPFLPNCGSTRAFASWLAPRGPRIVYDQRVVEGRKSRFTLVKMIGLAFDGLVRYSDAPLRFSTAVGTAATAFGLVMFVFAISATVAGRTVPGWASTITTIAIFSGLQSFALGILGEYLLRNWFRQSLPRFVAWRPSRVPDVDTSESEKQEGNSVSRFPPRVHGRSDAQHE